MSETPDYQRKTQSLPQQYLPLLHRALLFFLEDIDEARTVTDGAIEQAARQWAALEAEGNPMHVLGVAAADQCELLLPRSANRPGRRVPTSEQIVRHIEFYDWEQRLARVEVAIDVRRASVLENGGVPDEDAELLELKTRHVELLRNLLQVRLRLNSDDDEAAGGGLAAEIKIPPPEKGPGGGRTFGEALEPARNP